MAIDAGTLTIDVAPDVRNFGRQLAGEVAGEVRGNRGRFTQAFSRIGEFAVAGVVAAGAAAGTALVGGLVSAINTEQANDRLAAQLGLTVGESERIGRLAGDLYAQAYGESLAQVNSALAGVQANIGDLGSFSDAELSDIGASALDLASILDEDVGRATRGVGQLMRNGLAPDAEAAFDIIVAATQEGANASGDLIDTIEEYSPFFAELGLTGEQALGAIAAGLDAGARSGDLAADAFKEFSIRAVDGSALTAEGFQALGFDAEDMAAKIAGGGPAAAEATSEIIRALAGVTDPLAREAAGVALFGTQFEDLGPDVIEAMDPLAASLGDVGGAAERMGDTLNDNVATKIETFKREALQKLTAFVAEQVIPAFERIGAWWTEHGPGIVAAARPVVEGLASAFSTVVAFVTDTLVPAFREHLLPVFERLSDWWAENGPGIRAYIATSLGQAADFIRDTVVPAVRDQLIPLFERFAAFVRDELVPAVREHLLPVVQAVVEWVGEHLNPILVAAGVVGALLVAGVLALVGAFAIVVGPILALVAVLTGFIAAIKWTAKESVKAWTRIRDFVTEAVTAVRDRITAVTVAVRVTWARFWDAVRTKTATTWEAIRDKVAATLNAVRGNIAAVTAAIKTAWNNTWAAVLGFFAGAWDAIRSAFQSKWQQLRSSYDQATASFRQAFQSAWTQVRDFFGGVWDLIVNTFVGKWGSLRNAWDSAIASFRSSFESAWTQIRDFFAGVWQLIVDTFVGKWGSFRSAWDAAIAAFRGSFESAWTQVRDYFSGTWDLIVDIFAGKWGSLRSAFDGAIGSFRAAFITGWDTIRQAFVNVWDATLSFFSESVHPRFVAAFGALVEGIGRAWDGVRGAVRTPIAWVADNVYNRFRDVVNQVSGILGLGVNLPALVVPEFHSGGVVGQGGRPRDIAREPLRQGEQMAVVEDGEVILPAGERPPPVHVPKAAEPPPSGFTGIVSSVVGAIGRAVDAALAQGRQLIAEVARPAVEAALAIADSAGGQFGFFGRVAGGAMRLIGEGALGWLADVDRETEAEQNRRVPLLSPGIGYEAMIAALRTQFPGLALISGFRAGAVTAANGSPSFHASGRAVDIPPRHDVNRWIADNYQAITKELIFSLPGAINIKNGARRGFFSEPTFSDHLDHNHWAMARGAYVTSPTHALIGEAGPEIVAPEDKLEEIFTRVLERATLRRSGPMFGDVHVHDGVDIDLLMRKAEFHIAAGGL